MSLAMVVTTIATAGCIMAVMGLLRKLAAVWNNTDVETSKETLAYMCGKVVVGSNKSINHRLSQAEGCLLTTRNERTKRRHSLTRGAHSLESDDKTKRQHNDTVVGRYHTERGLFSISDDSELLKRRRCHVERDWSLISDGERFFRESNFLRGAKEDFMINNPETSQIISHGTPTAIELEIQQVPNPEKMSDQLHFTPTSIKSPESVAITEPTFARLGFIIISIDRYFDQLRALCPGCHKSLNDYETAATSLIGSIVSLNSEFFEELKASDECENMFYLNHLDRTVHDIQRWMQKMLNARASRDFWVAFKECPVLREELGFGGDISWGEEQEKAQRNKNKTKTRGKHRAVHGSK